MVEDYNSETVTHLLAQNKGSQFFSKVGGIIPISVHVLQHLELVYRKPGNFGGRGPKGGNFYYGEIYFGERAGLCV